MTDNRVFRTAVAEDAQGIAEVHATSWRETYTGSLPNDTLAQFDTAFRLRHWTRLLGTSPPWVFTCLIDGEVTGFSSVKPLEGAVCELNCLYVLKSGHGKGIGRKLFEMAAAKAKASGFDELCLWVLLGNPAAAFYEKMGCRFIANETVQIAERPVAVSRYRRNLG